MLPRQRLKVNASGSAWRVQRAGATGGGRSAGYFGQSNRQRIRGSIRLCGAGPYMKSARFNVIGVEIGTGATSDATAGAAGANDADCA